MTHNHDRMRYGEELESTAQNYGPSEVMRNSPRLPSDTWIWQVKHDKWNMTSETWHLTHDTWHMTHESDKFGTDSISFKLYMLETWGGKQTPPQNLF